MVQSMLSSQPQCMFMQLVPDIYIFQSNGAVSSFQAVLGSRPRTWPVQRLGPGKSRCPVYRTLNQRSEIGNLFEEEEEDKDCSAMAAELLSREDTPMLLQQAAFFSKCLTSNSIN
jgi:hypothetical protein